jgi:hypothetical protein
MFAARLELAESGTAAFGLQMRIAAVWQIKEPDGLAGWDALIEDKASRSRFIWEAA